MRCHRDTDVWELSAPLSPGCGSPDYGEDPDDYVPFGTTSTSKSKAESVEDKNLSDDMFV